MIFRQRLKYFRNEKDEKGYAEITTRSLSNIGFVWWCRSR